MYAQLTDLQKRLGTRFAAIYGTVHDEAASDLEAAAAEVDGYLANRYIVPVTAAAPAPLLKSWNLTLAEELAYSRAGGSSIPDKVAERAKTLRQQLSKVAEGVFKLPGARETDLGTGSAAIIQCDRPAFTRKQMEGF